jgi:hypothetical protein
VTGEDGADWPGLVLEWRHEADGWQARVVYVPGEGHLAVETWVPAVNLRPA